MGMYVPQMSRVCPAYIHRRRDPPAWFGRGISA